MTDETRLLLLKTDLGIMTTLYDARLLQYLEAAKQEIAREGYTLFNNTSGGDSDG